MKNYRPLEDGSGPKDAFLAVLQKEYDGRRRLYSKGVTNKVLNKVTSSRTSYVVPGELMKYFRVDVEAEKTQIVDMRRELEEDYGRKKAKLEVEHARKMVELDAMRETMVEDVMTKVLSKLPP